MNVVVVTASNEEHKYGKVLNVYNKDGTLIVISKKDRETMAVYNTGSWKYWKLDGKQ